jgi:hypothetical protein
MKIKVGAWALLLGMGALAFGQSSGSMQEMSVEESYLQQSVENVIIREQSRSADRTVKDHALNAINDAIDRGNTSSEVQIALEYLALEGLTRIARSNGRVVNNFPEIRRRAAITLSRIPSEDSKDTLLRLILIEKEPMVMTAAIKSLAEIGINDNNETLNVISWVLSHYGSMVGDEQLALSVLYAYERLGRGAGGAVDPMILASITQLANSPRYGRVVRTRAREVGDYLRGYTPMPEGR